MRWWWVFGRDGGSSERLGISTVWLRIEKYGCLQSCRREIHTSGSFLVSWSSQGYIAPGNVFINDMLLTCSWMISICIWYAMCCTHSWISRSVEFSDDGVLRGVALARVSSWLRSDLRFPPRNPTHFRWLEHRCLLTFVPEGFTHKNTRDTLNGNGSSTVHVWEASEENRRPFSGDPPVGLLQASNVHRMFWERTEMRPHWKQPIRSIVPLYC